MTTLIRLFVCVAVPAIPARTAAQTLEDPSTQPTGRVLLLTNERLLEGEIAQVGEQYRISRDGSGQTWLPRSKAQRLFGSRLEAFQYLRTQANLDDVDERMRLARWCIQYEMWPQALAELEAADQLLPREEQTLRLLAMVERRMQEATLPPNLPPEPIRVTISGAEPRTAQAGGPGSNAECMIFFARRVQPILMNACARCHVSGKASEFKLTQVFGDAAASGQSSQQNLIAVLGQITAGEFADSPFLRKAVAAHGGAGQPPLRNRDTPAYRTLEQWVKLAAKQTAKFAPVAADGPVSSTEKPMKNIFERVETKLSKSEPTAKKEAQAIPKEVFARDGSEKPAGPADEFDPVLFNRRPRPDKK
jgi:hypothetical protein